MGCPPFKVTYILFIKIKALGWGMKNSKVTKENRMKKKKSVSSFFFLVCEWKIFSQSDWPLLSLSQFLAFDIFHYFWILERKVKLVFILKVSLFKQFMIFPKLPKSSWYFAKFPELYFTGEILHKGNLPELL